MAINSENLSGIYVEMIPPSLTYPNGGESINTFYIPIRWVEPSFVESSNFVFWYEIYFTDTYREKREPNWVQIARVPSGISSYDWYLNKRVIGDDCRIGIRTVDHQGFRSEMCISANSFGLGKKNIPPPVVFEPSSGFTYFDYISIALDNKGILGSYSQRSYYRLSYSCNSLNIGQTIISDNVPISSSIVYWDVKNFQSASDYVLRVEFLEGDNVSI
ncbi:MAG: hypothetical protein J7L15_00675, partial [Clostridiales bacterium]|nr:hypothetical protein [Clostridiales bacterium]